MYVFIFLSLFFQSGVLRHMIQGNSPFSFWWVGHALRLCEHTVFDIKDQSVKGLNI